MRKIKKQPKDMTTEELAKKIFPKKVHEKLKEIAHKGDNKIDSDSSSQE